MKKNQTLLELKLFTNPLMDAGVYSLTKALQVNTHLRSLNLSSLDYLLHSYWKDLIPNLSIYDIYAAQQKEQAVYTKEVQRMACLYLNVARLIVQARQLENSLLNTLPIEYQEHIVNCLDTQQYLSSLQRRNIWNYVAERPSPSYSKSSFLRFTFFNRKVIKCLDLSAIESQLSTDDNVIELLPNPYKRHRLS